MWKILKNKISKILLEEWIGLFLLVNMLFLLLFTDLSEIRNLIVFYSYFIVSIILGGIAKIRTDIKKLANTNQETYREIKKGDFSFEVFDGWVTNTNPKNKTTQSEQAEIIRKGN